MEEQKMVDHLFRHQYGKMVSILTRIFGLSYLPMIEDAVQDTFMSAMRSWQSKIPDNPEAWLTKSAKNRVLDLIRKLSAEDARIAGIQAGTETIAIHKLFLESEVNDSVLRMIFTACNPILHPRDQIAFALKTISGFSRKEIASSLLLKEETVKKRLSRARKKIREHHIAFEIPVGPELKDRLNRVLEVIYLIFNEGFHSNRKDQLIREELCGEAMRLTRVLLDNPYTATPDCHAIFALFCFQAARLKSKTNDRRELVSLRDQDRSKWFYPLVALGHQNMTKAVEADHFSTYHYEAAIAAEHTQAASYQATNWNKILTYYELLHQLEPSPFNLLNIAVVQLQRKNLSAVKRLLDQIKPDHLEQRAYLYYGTYAEYAHFAGQQEKRSHYIDKAIELVENEAERRYLVRKKMEYEIGSRD